MPKGQENFLVSIIMPVYNGEKYIQKAINSVLNQEHENWQLLIVNDGSTDHSKEIILSFNDPRIYYSEQENKGVSAARNVGLKKMNGDFFCFLDADDLLPPNSISERLSIFNNYSNLEFVDGRVEVFKDNSEQIINEFKPSFQGNPFQELVNLKDSCFFSPTWLVKVMPNKKYSFNENLSYCEDIFFYLSISRYTGNYSFADSVIYRYRKGSDSAMSNLQNLEKGYFSFIEELIKNSFITHEQKTKLVRKVKMIMFKSYLSNFHLPNAIKIYFK